MRRIFALILILLSTACTTVELEGGIRHTFFPWEVRHISPEGSTSQCLGDFTDPVCALETLIACRVAGQEFMGCYGNEYDDDERRIKRGNPYTEYVIVRSSYLYEAGNKKYEELYPSEDPVDEMTKEEEWITTNSYRNMLCRLYFGSNCDCDISDENKCRDTRATIVSDKRLHQAWVLIRYNNDFWQPYDFVYGPYNLNGINIWHVYNVNDFHKEDYWLGD